MSKVLRYALLTVGLAATIGVTSCSGTTQDLEPAPTSSPSSSPSSSTATPAAPSTMDPERISRILTMTEDDLIKASEAIAPLKAVEGRYVIAPGYRLHNTLTALKLESGETVYFVTNNGRPFAVDGSGTAVAADQYSRDVTGFGELVKVDGPAGLDAAHMLSDMRQYLE